MKKVYLSILAIISVIFFTLLFFQVLFKEKDQAQVAGVNQSQNTLPSSQLQTEVLKISPSDFRKYIAEVNPIIIDIRTAQEFASGNIDGSMNMDFYASEFFTQLDKLDRNANYAIYCRSGNRSGQTLQKMKEMGFLNVKELSGGINNYSL